MFKHSSKTRTNRWKTQITTGFQQVIRDVVVLLSYRSQSCLMGIILAHSPFDSCQAAPSPERGQYLAVLQGLSSSLGCTVRKGSRILTLWDSRGDCWQQNARTWKASDPSISSGNMAKLCNTIASISTHHSICIANLY